MPQLAFYRQIHADVGVPPMINVIQGQGVIGLPFNQAGNNLQIAYFIISNNHSTAFDVTFRFSNKGKFAGSAGGEVPFTVLTLHGVSGTLGSSLTAPVNQSLLPLDGDGEYLWDPGGTQITETTNYLVEIKASWNHPGALLAGFYFEGIRATITVGL